MAIKLGHARVREPLFDHEAVKARSEQIVIRVSDCGQDTSVSPCPR